MFKKLLFALLATFAINASDFHGDYSYIESHVDEKGALFLTITTKDGICLQSLALDEEIEAFAEIKTRPENYLYYASGTSSVPAAEKVREREEARRERFRRGDPYSVYVIYYEDQIVGQAVLGKGDDPHPAPDDPTEGVNAPGFSEYAIMVDQAFWGRGIGKSVTRAILKDLGTFLKREGYTVSGGELEHLVATTSPENEAMIRILDEVCDRFEILNPDENRFGIAKRHYWIDL